MIRIAWVAAVVLVAFGAVSLKAADEAAKKRRGGFGRTIPYTMEMIKERLGTENALKGDQEKKVQSINDEFTKKMEAYKEKPEVKAAHEEMAKAREARDMNKMREAFKKLRESAAGNPYEGYKKALSGVLDEAQVAKLFPQRRGRDRQRGGGEKPAAK